MSRRIRVARSALLAAAVAAAACGTPRTPEQQIVDDAAAALGGRERVLSVRTIAMEGEGTQYNLGQDMRPDARDQTFTVNAFARQLDLDGRRARTELTRTPNFPYFQGQAPQRQTQGLDGELAYNVGASGAAVRAGDQAARDRRAEFYHHPVTAVRAGLGENASLANTRTENGERLVDVTVDDLTFTLAIDASNLPSRIESAGDHPNLGDVRMITRFGSYGEVDGLRLPGTMTMQVDDFITTELRLTRHVVNGDAHDLAAPAEVAGAPPAPAAAPSVVPELVAPGVWLLAGGSHHSALVELSDHLMLIDAPQSEARTQAAIAAARDLVSGKPLTTLVVTHHHFDHTAGLRAAVAEGLRVIAHEGNRAWVEDMVRRTHSRQPDALARNPRPPAIEAVRADTLISDPLRPVALYHVEGNPHSDTMLMVYLPQERLLIQVDAFSPAAQVHPYAANLLDNIRRRQLRVERIVPLHGRVVSVSELEQAVAGR